MGTLDLSVVENLPHNDDPCLFMEALLNCVRNKVISYQAFIGKRKALYIKLSLDNLKVLKTNYNVNFEQILTLETELNNFYDSELTWKNTRFLNI